MKTFHSLGKNRIFIVLTLAVAICNLWLVFWVTPMIPQQELAQKIFYYHVPLAWNAFLAFVFVAATGIVYLQTRQPKWDYWSLAGAEVGTMFALLILITGPIWAVPVWGKPWSWEPRLTTTLILVLIYAGYFMVRAFGGTYERASRYAAVVGILAVIDIPVIFTAVTWWAPEVQSHPQIGMIQQPTGILVIFFFSLFSFTLILIHLLRYRRYVIGFRFRRLMKSEGFDNG